MAAVDGRESNEPYTMSLPSRNVCDDHCRRSRRIIWKGPDTGAHDMRPVWIDDAGFGVNYPDLDALGVINTVRVAAL
jgi:hypothetical protein